MDPAMGEEFTGPPKPSLPNLLFHSGKGLSSEWARRVTAVWPALSGCLCSGYFIGWRRPAMCDLLMSTAKQV